MNDYEILYMICEGEESNFEILVNKYELAEMFNMELPEEDDFDM